MWHYLALIRIKQGYSNTWIHINDLLNESDEVKYINAFFYSVLTMITVGHFKIISPIEKLFSIIIVLMLSGAFAYSLNRIGNILEYMFKSEVELKYKKKKILYIL